MTLKEALDQLKFMTPPSAQLAEALTVVMAAASAKAKPEPEEEDEPERKTSPRHKK
jgi:hypothetical protein